MIKEFEYYLKNNLVRKGSVNKIEAKALIQKAENRIKFSIKERKINENTSSFVFEEIYECLREAFQSLMSLRGYKPYSHEVIISFLKKFCQFEEQTISIFNNYRILRNKTVYGGEKISIEKCKETLKYLYQTLPKIKENFQELNQ